MPRHPTIAIMMPGLLSNVKVTAGKGADGSEVGDGCRRSGADVGGAPHHPEDLLRCALGGVAACAAAAVAMLAACDATPVTKPITDPGPRATVGLVGGDTIPPCPEIAIPELPCLRHDPRPPPRPTQD
jgi:hypothetical protein